jgi:5-methylcytosine-specific restriction endonuclease McrA
MTARVLVLDQGYQPHRIVNWQRAIVMIFREVAEVVENYDEDISSVTFTMKMPAVIRLLKRITRRRAVKFSRMNVLLRDKFKCQYCGEKKPTKDLNYDHVLPRSQGGKTTWENIVTSCYDCNHRKAGRTPEQAKMQLLTKPVKPRSLPLVAFHIDQSDTVPEAWRNFLYWHGKLEEDHA